MQSILVFVALCIDKLEGLGHDEALSLGDTAREMGVDLLVAVDVVETLPVGRVDIDGHLPCRPPVGDVLACERVGGTLQLYDDRTDLLWVLSLVEVEVAVGGVQHARVGYKPIE